ncbi:MAG: hypothetical protein IAE83_04095 [Anaerolinea sp.]|nr:hypothetical protein [Anaerolinea sp.]MCC6974147.1 hypothetical protein [Anaerolineae bacterium]CAG0999353.1 hypothetical protein ANRL4_03010 [Anaerolineae bacterium]
MPYKHLYTGLFNADDKLDLAASLSLAGGMLRITIGERSETLDFEGPVVGSSSSFRFSDHAHLETNSGRFAIHLETTPQHGTVEYWLNCQDLTTLRSRRFKLNAEASRSDNTSEPRIGSVFGAMLFAVDDGGIVRLYRPPEFTEVGTFQVAQPGTENRLLALAISRDGNLVAALNRWRTVILYHIEQRRIIFTRQLSDADKWYEPGQGVLFFTLNAEYIISAAAVSKEDHLTAAVNVLQFFPLNAGGNPAQ